MGIGNIFKKETMINDIATHRAKTTGADHDTTVNELNKLPKKAIYALWSQMFDEINPQTAEEFVAYFA